MPYSLQYPVPSFLNLASYIIRYWRSYPARIIPIIPVNHFAILTVQILLAFKGINNAMHFSNWRVMSSIIEEEVVQLAVRPCARIHLFVCQEIEPLSKGSTPQNSCGQKEIFYTISCIATLALKWYPTDYSRD